MIKLPKDHPSRFTVANEVHARPPEPLNAPVSITCIALMTDWLYRDEDRQIVCDLARRFKALEPPPGAKHYSVDFGFFRLVWERHTEMTRYFFIAPCDERDPFAAPAINRAPEDWVAALPGALIAAINVALVGDMWEGQNHDEMSAKFFGGNALVGAIVTGGASVALTDFRINPDGYTRFLVQNQSMGPWHAGRIVQRLHEIETYRLLALFALPVAQALSPRLNGWEQTLQQVTTNMTEGRESDEPKFLDQLTKLQAAIERARTESQFRFSASAAYYALVRARIEELREERLKGMQTFGEFMERRLGPAMSTCVATAARIDALSGRVDRATQLLSTRVDMTLERQNQAVLESMNRRAQLQLRLQQTVEGLSIAAVSYYVVGLVGYVAKGLHNMGVPIKAEIVMGLSVPVVLLFAGFGINRIRRAFTQADVNRGDQSQPANATE